jgi:hypothetical protein
LRESGATAAFGAVVRFDVMGQNNDPNEHGDLQGQQGVVGTAQKPGPPKVPSLTSRNGVDELKGGEADKPGQSPHDERSDQQPKS